MPEICKTHTVQMLTINFDTNPDILLVLYCGPSIASIRDPATNVTHFTLTSQPLWLRGGVGGQFPRNLN